jgi:tRNA threonylcarbamoyladenosine modification (KEOPS) complex  Pcc1 subunit
MRYSLILRIDNLSAYELLKPDLQKARKDRSRIELSKKEGKTLVEIEAEDAVALRASVDSIVQLLKVYEKMGGAR